MIGNSPTVMVLTTDKSPQSLRVPGLLETRLDLAEPLTEWRMQDGLGSIVQRTDDHGNVTADHFYEPFGSRQYGLKDPLHREGFTGHQHDDSLGLIYMNARWQHSTIGMFASRDPACGVRKSNEGTLYAYVVNNPTNAVDPTGKFLEWLIPLLLPTKANDDNPPGAVEVDVEADPAPEATEDRPKEQPAHERSSGEVTMSAIPVKGRKGNHCEGIWRKKFQESDNTRWQWGHWGCKCWWLCESCHGTIWSGSKDGLVQTAGTWLNGRGNIEEGDDCACNFPGSYSGCSGNPR